MTTATLPVSGPISEIRDGRIIVDNGDRRDSYSLRHYHVDTPMPPQRLMDKQQTIDNLIELAQTTKMFMARRVYWEQGLAMMRRRMPK